MTSTLPPAPLLVGGAHPLHAPHPSHAPHICRERRTSLMDSGGLVLGGSECGAPPMLNGLDPAPPYAMYPPHALVYDSEGEASEGSGSQTEGEGDGGETTTEGERSPEPRVGYVSTFFRCGCSCCWRYQLCRMGGKSYGYSPPSAVFDDDPGIMSEAETASTGFRRGGKQRASLPPARSPSAKTLDARSFGEC
ncbi:uncharacterized protein LOC126986342 [Eriocheir sinensis]|uniref:uncharacterized protein LOC126986342 n=1 Tax=Eriocheir sinensis TaxID=95602 RepID=UPI0021CA87ED|nr:uncharacterized protein LOC126986342 [Eriocheir sinensis]